MTPVPPCVTAVHQEGLIRQSFGSDPLCATTLLFSKQNWDTAPGRKVLVFSEDSGPRRVWEF